MSTESLHKTKKPAGFSRSETSAAEIGKALAHPARIAILNLLIQKRSCICGDIVDELPLAQSTVSQHLKVLKEAGLIKGQIEGSSICYCIDPQNWRRAALMLETFFNGYQPLEQSCC